MNEQIIPSSQTALQRQLILSALVAAGICVLGTLLLLSLYFMPRLQYPLITALWITVPLLWVLGAVIAFTKNSKTNYILTDDAIIKEKKGFFGTKTNQLYRYDTIASVNSKSRANGKFGTLELLFEPAGSLVIDGIIDPDTYAREIKKRASSARSTRVNYSAK